MAKITEQEARAIKDRNSAALLETRGVHAVGTEADKFGNQMLVILVDPTAERTKLPSEIEGLPVLIQDTGGPFKAR